MTSSNETRVNGIPHFDVEINDKNIDTVVKMLISHIKKMWDIKQLRSKAFNDGVTNKLIGYYIDDGNIKISKSFGEHGRSEIILVRIYGVKTELIIDRAKELHSFQELTRNGLAPPLYCTFGNGYCYKYVEGMVLNPDSFKEANVLEHCAQLVAKIHSIELSDEYHSHYKMESSLFKTIHKYINLIPQQFNEVEKQKKFEEKIAPLQALRNEVDMIAEAVSNLKRDKTLAFCHNDLLCANFIFDEYQEKMYCIDYEYGCPNYIAYDIANHFCEFAGIGTVDYSLYPDKTKQLGWIRIYLEEFRSIKGQKELVSDAEIENLYVHISKFALAAHLFWGTWALIQSHYSQIDFDYLEYAAIRFNEYFTKKDQCLALIEDN